MVLPAFFVKDHDCIQDVLLEQSLFFSWVYFCHIWVCMWICIKACAQSCGGGKGEGHAVHPRFSMLWCWGLVHSWTELWGFFCLPSPMSQVWEIKGNLLLGCILVLLLPLWAWAPLEGTSSTQVMGYCLSLSLKIHFAKHFLITTSCVIISWKQFLEQSISGGRTIMLL